MKKTVLFLFVALLSCANVFADEITITFADVAAENGWENGVAQTDVTIGDFHFVVSGGGNNGKYYTSDTTWRFYNGGGLTISSDKATITGVTSKASQSFTVADGEAKTSFSASVKIKSITITYTAKGEQNAPATPTFSVNGGTYTSAQEVSLACTTVGADIYYTLDGTDPTAESTKYTAPITISETTTVKAVAVKDDVLSTVATQTYKIVSIAGDGSKENPYTVSDVKLLNNNGKTAWVIGTVYGVFANNAATATVGSTASNIALSQDESFIPVQLPTGDVRDALNLVDNPELKGGMVKVYGDLVSYFSTTGVKNVTDYEIIYTTGISEVEAKTANGKFLENGRIVIMKNGKKFNIAGQKL